MFFSCHVLIILLLSRSLYTTPDTEKIPTIFQTIGIFGFVTFLVVESAVICITEIEGINLLFVTCEFNTGIENTIRGEEVC